MRSIVKEKTTVALYLLCIIPALIFIIAFYRAELPAPGFSKEQAPTLRSYLDERLFDLRSIIMPKYDVSSDIVLASFSESDVEAYRKAGRVWDEGVFLDAAEAVLRIGPKKLVVFIQPDWLGLESPFFGRLATLLRNHPNLYCASIGMNTQYPSSFKIPAKFEDISSRILGVGQFRKRRHDILRRFPLVGYRGSELKELLWTFLADYRYDKPRTTPSDKRLLHYANLDSIQSFAGTALLREASVGSVTSKVSGHIVFLNYDHYAVLESVSDQFRANTPWQVYGGDAEEGVSVARLATVMFDNLRLDRVYRVVDYPFALVTQAAAIAIFSMLVWSYGVAFGFFLLSLAWLILLNGHGLLQHFFNIYVPLSDAVLFSLIFAVFGILLQLTREAKERAEEEARMAQKEEVANMQSNFLSHFGEQLSLLNEGVWAHLVLQENLYLHDEKLKLYYSKFRQSCQELGEYLQGIAQFSKVSNNRRISVKFEKILFKPFAERIIRQFESLVEENKIGVSLAVGENEFIYCDPNLLEPILFNLVSNAIKYSPLGGVVIVGLETVDTVTRRLYVKDRGIGISDDYLLKIFEKFYRIKDDYVYKIKGHGLGLYLCQFFATKLGTQIAVKSRKGEGSEFSLIVRGQP